MSVRPRVSFFKFLEDVVYTWHKYRLKFPDELSFDSFILYFVKQNYCKYRFQIKNKLFTS